MKSLIFIVSLACGIMLGGVYYAVYLNAIEALVVGFLLFTAMDSGMSSILNTPSWIAESVKRWEEKGWWQS